AAAASTPDGIPTDMPVVPGRIVLSADGRRVYLTPLTPLEPESDYSFVVSSRLTSAGGRPVMNPDGKARTFVGSFRTGSGYRPPLVTLLAMEPPPNATV